mmetsp:Transcript_50403/g.133922  ORF Transcript_50403/g.133922 Transcript_50403/m.133922 type:complete len:106 (-) Transcript_50403:98-415(-)
MVLIGGCGAESMIMAFLVTRSLRASGASTRLRHSLLMSNRLNYDWNYLRMTRTTPTATMAEEVFQADFPNREFQNLLDGMGLLGLRGQLEQRRILKTGTTASAVA